jgi:hypothetical protein
MNSIWLQTSALVLLGGYLLLKHWERLKAARQAEALRRLNPGKAIEATPLLNQIKLARTEQLGLTRLPRRHSGAHQEFAAKVGQSLRRLAFFSGRSDVHPEPLSEEHPA